MKPVNIVLITFFLVISLISCDKNQIQAEKSITGTWSVTSITTQYGEFTNSTFVESSTLSETGDLGTFIFTDTKVSYDFNGNDKQYKNETSWVLNYEKVNSGFVRVPQYLLNVGDDFVFEILFEDGTKNAEKNAQKATFRQVSQIGDLESIAIEVEKN